MNIYIAPFKGQSGYQTRGYHRQVQKMGFIFFLRAPCQSEASDCKTTGAGATACWGEGAAAQRPALEVARPCGQKGTQSDLGVLAGAGPLPTGPWPCAALKEEAQACHQL